MPETSKYRCEFCHKFESDDLGAVFFHEMVCPKNPHDPPPQWPKINDTKSEVEDDNH